MKCLDLTLPTPAENLACDEALLDRCENGAGQEVLRFWEPQQYFVVVGYANRLATEVNRDRCAARGVPILRRCSGGGTVLQGPGCLNYSLILRVNAGPLGSIPAANRFIMERNRSALQSLLSGSTEAGATSRQQPSPPANRPPPVEVRGHTDLALGKRKVSGNAQRRKRRFLLFHGTFLLRFDLTLIELLLPPPSRQPEYRRNRPHCDFLANLELPGEAVKGALQQAWGASEPLIEVPRNEIALLARVKYATIHWNEKF